MSPAPPDGLVYPSPQEITATLSKRTRLYPRTTVRSSPKTARVWGNRSNNHD